MKYQKFIPGDIVFRKNEDRIPIYYIVLKINGNITKLFKITNFNIARFNIEKVLLLTKEKCLGTEIANIREEETDNFFYNENYQIYKRLFTNTSDYFCRKLCKIKLNCQECPLLVPLENLGRFFFIGDIVFYKGYKLVIEGCYINSIIDLLRSDNRFIESLEKENINEIYENLKNHELHREIEMLYTLKFLDSNSDNTVDIKREYLYSMKLNQRIGYTIDLEDIDKFCSLCINDNCKNCELYEKKQRRIS